MQLTIVLKTTKAFVDHHQFTEHDFALFDANIPLLMTEKDAVKCQHLANENVWYLAVDAEFSVQDKQLIIEKIKKFGNIRKIFLMKYIKIPIK